MKKFLVVFMILAVAGGVFAQDVTVSGQVATGLLIEQQKGVNDDELTIKGYSDSEEVPLRADVEVHAAWEKVGAKIKLRDDFSYLALNQAVIGDIGADLAGATPGPANAADPSNYAHVFTAPYAFLYANVLNDMIKISGGALDDAAWATEGDWDDSYDNLNGVRVEIKPIPGLNIGFALDLASAVARGGATAGAALFKDFIQESVVGAKYSTDIFSAVLALKLDSDAAGTNEEYEMPGFLAGANFGLITIPETVTYTDANENTKVLFSVNVKAVPKLTAIIDGQLTGLSSSNDMMAIDIRETFGYQISDVLEAHLTLAQAGIFDDPYDMGYYFEIKPGASYAIFPDKFYGKLDLEVNTYTGEFFDPMQFVLKPGIEWRYANNATCNVWYKGAFLSDSDFGEPKHEIQLDFVWTW